MVLVLIETGGKMYLARFPSDYVNRVVQLDAVAECLRNGLWRAAAESIETVRDGDILDIPFGSRYITIWSDL